MFGTLNLSNTFAFGNIAILEFVYIITIVIFNWYGFSIDTDKLVYNVNSTKTHSFQHRGTEIQ